MTQNQVIHEVSQVEQQYDANNSEFVIRQVKQTSRDVDRIISRMTSSLQPSHKQKNINEQQYIVVPHKQYYRGIYRHEQKKIIDEVPQASINERCRTEIIKKRKKKFQTVSERGSIDASLEVNLDNLVFPSNNYYISFDKSNLNKQQELNVNSNSNWLMNKKINNLQKQVNSLKKQQQQRPKIDKRVKLNHQIQSLINTLQI